VQQNCIIIYIHSVITFYPNNYTIQIWNCKIFFSNVRHEIKLGFTYLILL